MDPSMLRSPRIEQFLDICTLPQAALHSRVPSPMLVLEMEQKALQKRLAGFQTSALDTEAVRTLWSQMATLAKEGKRLRSDGLVRYVFEVSKRKEGAFTRHITVGRTKANDICLPDDCISKLHAYFDVDEAGNYGIHDVGSRNRTCVNGHSLPPRERRVLSSGDRISFAKYAMTFLSPMDFAAYVTRLIEDKQPREPS